MRLAILVVQCDKVRKEWNKCQINWAKALIIIEYFDPLAKANGKRDLSFGSLYLK